jgi:lambda family phage portal protein
LRRARARLAFERASLYFDAARHDRRGANWASRAVSANAASEGKLSTLRARSADLIRNHPHGRRARNEFALRLVGTGLRPRFDAGSDAVSRRVLESWGEFSEHASADGLPSFESMQAMIASAWFERGEVFLRRRDRRTSDGLRVPLQVQVLEADFVDHQKNQDLGLNGRIVQGVEFSAIGKRRAYWMFENHPGDSFASPRAFGSRPIAAEEVAHLYEWETPGQIHGLPMLVAVIALLYDIGEYEEAEIMRKKLEACHVGFVQQSDLATAAATSSTEKDTAGRTIQRFEPGMFVYGQPGETIEFNNPQGNGAYEAYKKARLRDLATGVHQPYPVIAEDPGAANYSSSRMGAVGFRDRIIQQRWLWFVPMCCNPVAKWFLDSCRRVSILPEETRVAIEWSEPAFALLDRNEEAKGTTAMLRNLTMTPQQAVGEQGWEWRDQIAEWRQALADMEAAGVASDGDARKAREQGENPPQA